MANVKDKNFTAAQLVFNAYKWFMYACSAILFLVAVLCVFIQVTTKQPLDYNLIIVFGMPAICVVAFVLSKHFYKTQNRS